MTPMHDRGYGNFESSYCTVCECLIDGKPETSLYCSKACRKRDAKELFSMPVDEVRSTFQRTKSATSLTGLAELATHSPATAHKLCTPARPILTPLTPSILSDGTEPKGDAGERSADKTMKARERPLPPKRTSYSSSVPRSIDLVTPDPQLLSLSPLKRDQPKIRIAAFGLSGDARPRSPLHKDPGSGC
ncbi:hypothetical protein BCR37DRAFT_392349 [Protomyces lactucae-debilis]|uniref:Life-span regulatory factor-domain-containing protein n=1 Tax=Protomyces lactucae-debilis TaxID=2754530 RepID=A0A1Y2FIY2_PROLT|nr:uncharacterized protein BCR37DRAFT_392349 [Protomyces lactucae-debilis]ORY83900.1 hypothetical protein BCR37DRAFT_392349 [Protomyces lactucae-debilis]